MAQTRMERALEAAESEIRELRDELDDTNKQMEHLERFAEKRRNKVLKAMMNRPIAVAFNSWRQFVRDAYERALQVGTGWRVLWMGDHAHRRVSSGENFQIKKRGF